MESMSGAPTPAAGSDARLQVRLPAILLMVTGGFGVVFALLGFFERVAGPNNTQAQENMNNPNLPNWLKTATSISDLREVGFVMAVLSVTVNAFILFGALKMKNLESHRLAMAASIIAIIPCFACFFSAFHVGIWCLVVLSKPTVKAAFHTT